MRGLFSEPVHLSLLPDCHLVFNRDSPACSPVSWLVACLPGTWLCSQSTGSAPACSLSVSLAQFVALVELWINGPGLSLAFGFLNTRPWNELLKRKGFLLPKSEILKIYVIARTISVVEKTSIILLLWNFFYYKGKWISVVIRSGFQLREIVNFSYLSTYEVIQFKEKEDYGSWDCVEPPPPSSDLPLWTL